jgi:hypothetical protein
MKDDDKKVAFEMNGFGDGASMFTFDMSTFMDGEGKLTEEGRVKLKAQMLSSFEGKVEPADKARLEAAIDEFLRAGAEDSAFVMSCKSIGTVLDRVRLRIEDMPEAMRGLARLLSTDKPLTSAPHVYALGEAAALLAAAASQIRTARTLIHGVLSCETGRAHCSEPENETSHSPKGGLWS